MPRQDQCAECSPVTKGAGLAETFRQNGPLDADSILRRKVKKRLRQICNCFSTPDGKLLQSRLSIFDSLHDKPRIYYTVEVIKGPYLTGSMLVHGLLGIAPLFGWPKISAHQSDAISLDYAPKEGD